jgi:hypothetical protein
MKPSDPAPASCASPLPVRLLLFTRPTWSNALLLLTGAILAPGKRTVTAALRILGREQDTDFPIYHGVLNRAVWSSRAVAAWLLRLLVATFLDADAIVVIGIDDTIERRWGHKISVRARWLNRSARMACAPASSRPLTAMVFRTKRSWVTHGIGA